DYKPVLEDWRWHAALTLVAYAAMVHAGLRLSRVSADALYIVGGSALLLVFIGIHNAWDTVMYVTLARSRERREQAAAATRAAERHSAPGSSPVAGKDIKPPGPPPARHP